MNRKSRILQYSVQTQTTCADALTRSRADARTDVSSKVNYRGACAPKKDRLEILIKVLPNVAKY